MFNNFFADDWIRITDLWNRKQLLYQLSHNHCPTFVSFIICVRAKDNEINEPWWQPSSFHRAAIGRHWILITFGIEAKILVEPLPRLLKKCFKANTTTIKKTNYEEEKSFSIFGFSNYNFVSKEILCFLKKDSYIL